MLSKNFYSERKELNSSVFILINHKLIMLKKLGIQEIYVLKTLVVFRHLKLVFGLHNFFKYLTSCAFSKRTLYISLAGLINKYFAENIIAYLAFFLKLFSLLSCRKWTSVIGGKKFI